MSPSLETNASEDYRRRAQAWLSANLVRLDDGNRSKADRALTPERVARARILQRRLFDGGFAGITYPVAYGGQGLSLDHEQIFLQEAANFEMPSRVFDVSLNILGPTLLGFGSEEQKQRHLSRMLSGEELWLQLLSEPSGGSDLAGLLTRADRDGDTYVLNGQKTWSTGASHSDFAMCPARTRWDVPKHKGISVFMVDLRSKGIDIRPIRQINGNSDFCEEFFTDVVVPAANLIGDENEGWRVARGLLEIEHAWVGRSVTSTRSFGGVDDLISVARRRGVNLDPGVRRKIALMHAEQEVHTLTATRVAAGMAAGQLSPGLGGALKLGTANLGQRRAELGLSLAGSQGIAWTEDTLRQDNWSSAFLDSRRLTIAGGTNEVQRNNIGERGLGLPREPLFDREIPFNEVLRQ